MRSPEESASPGHSVAPAITGLLNECARGLPEAKQALYEAVYGELRHMAHGLMKRERPDHTWQPTALVNEAFQRLGGRDAQVFQNRRHFFGAAAQAMRRLLIDHARVRPIWKRGNDPAAIDAVLERVRTDFGGDLEALEQALHSLSNDHPRPAEVIQLRYFVGMTTEQAGDCLGLSPRTITLDTALAIAYLRRHLQSNT